MRLGILQTGTPPEELARFGSYPAMFRKLLGESAYDYVTFDVAAGELPDGADECPAYLVTGSSSGAYEPLPWIAALKQFLNGAKGKAALVGICFGHQVMAEAFGGKVTPSSKGWGLGAQSYRVFRPQPWMDHPETFALPASHHDQVVVAPPATEVVAGSDFAPLGMLAYQDQPAISLQLHPEFEPDFATALVERRRDRGLTQEQADRAAASLRAPNDSPRVGQWIRTFLNEASVMP